MKFCLGLPFNASLEVVLWDCGQLDVVSRRLQLTSRFYAHLSAVHSGRLLYHAVRDSMALALEANKGWYQGFKDRCPVELPALDNDCLEFPARVETALKDRQWRQVIAATESSLTLRSLNWSPPRRTLEKAGYLYLAKHKTRAVARLRTGTNGLAVHRQAWLGVAWYDRKCKLCNAVETESHVLTECGAFLPERCTFYKEMAELDSEVFTWGTDKFMKVMVSPSRVQASIVARYWRAIWQDIDEWVVVINSI